MFDKSENEIITPEDYSFWVATKQDEPRPIVEVLVDVLTETLNASDTIAMKQTVSGWMPQACIGNCEYNEENVDYFWFMKTIKKKVNGKSYISEKAVLDENTGTGRWDGELSQVMSKLTLVKKKDEQGQYYLEQEGEIAEKVHGWVVKSWLVKHQPSSDKKGLIVDEVIWERNLDEQDPDSEKVKVFTKSAWPDYGNNNKIQEIEDFFEI